MENVCSPYFDPEFDQLGERIFGPTCTVSIDNESMRDCTMVKVDSVKKQGLLLEVVQVLTDMNLTISKGYISSDGVWHMDVFYVKDVRGNKLTDQKKINHIQQAIGTSRTTITTTNANSNGANAFTTTTTALHQPKKSSHARDEPITGTSIEMTGTDRPGLFSEISAALAQLQCNIIEAHAWSHNKRLACVAYILDQSTNSPISNNKLTAIEDRLTTLLRSTTTATSEFPSCVSDGNATTQQEAKTTGLPDSESGSMTTVERRLHQLMVSARDYDTPSPAGTSIPNTLEKKHMSSIVISNCKDKGYSIVTIQCGDRPRLMFDTVCTLTDMQYVVFHASVDSREGCAFQEYFIRHIDGCALNTEGEKERVIKCLEAAIERRVCEGVRVELCANNRIGLLSDITQIFRENGLVVVRADVETHKDKPTLVDATLYLRDISGNDINIKLIESVKRQISMGPKSDHLQLVVKNIDDNIKPLVKPLPKNSSPDRAFSFKDLIKSQIERFSHNFVSIR